MNVPGAGAYGTEKECVTCLLNASSFSKALLQFCHLFPLFSSYLFPKPIKMQTGDFKGFSLITGSKTSEAWDSSEIWLFNASILIEIIGFLKAHNWKRYLLLSIKPIDILHLLLQKCDSDFMESAKHTQFALMKAVEFSSEIHPSLIACRRSDGFLKASTVNAALGEVKLPVLSLGRPEFHAKHLSSY